MTFKQLPLFSSEKLQSTSYQFPSTRYQGSKRKIIEWIWGNVSQLEFNTVLDVFGGTGVVSHKFKNEGKCVTYNDLLAFNHNIGLALIENKDQTISDQETELILRTHENIDYPNFIEKNFENIYFTNEENKWLDHVIYNINHFIDNPYKQALIRFALFQACIIKRPYNLFHRANLYMRTSKVKRSFGNKTTWDTPFETHFRNFILEANQAVFDNSQTNQAIQCDALETPKNFDLVYIDPPYLNKKGTGVDYRSFYHFLEGIMNYEQWHEKIDYKSKHRRLIPQKSLWNNASTISDVFEQLIKHHQTSILVISYRDDGIPSKQEIIDILRKYRSQVTEATLPMKYVLAHKKSHEVLLIAT